jgi:hypothetical protein
MSGRTQAYDATAPGFQASSPEPNRAASRYGAMPKPHDPSYNRDEDQKPGAPQRMAQEPKGSEGSSRTAKTRTDPVSGESRSDGHAPNQAVTDQTDGAGKPSRP